jgi:tripartite-type tricarboxylate transporter receptor subunit TctC
MTMTRRAALTGIATLAGSAFAPALRSQPSNFPAGIGTIKIVIPFAPGGASDIIGRLLAANLTNRWDVPATLEHVPGASATVGFGRVAHGPTDGSQILLLNILYVTTQYIMSRLPYEPERDILPLAQLTAQPNLLCVKKDLPVSSVAELITYAKDRPGQLNYASSGVGSPLHLAAELFQHMTGTRMTHVPYPGSAPSQTALAGGHVDVLFDNAAAIIGLARSGAVKALGITTPARYRLAPEFPAVAETVPGYAAGGWFGVAVRSGTPAHIQDAIEAASLDLVKAPSTVEQLAKSLSEPVGSGREGFAKFIGEERARWGSLIGELKLRQ